MAELKEKETIEFLKEQFYNYVGEIVLTEKWSRLLELENKMVFKLRNNLNKTTLKALFEAEYNEEVKKINVVNDINGYKKVIVTFKKEGFASELASKLGVM